MFKRLLTTETASQILAEIYSSGAILTPEHRHYADVIDERYQLTLIEMVRWIQRLESARRDVLSGKPGAAPLGEGLSGHIDSLLTHCYQILDAPEPEQGATEFLAGFDAPDQGLSFHPLILAISCFVV